MTEPALPEDVLRFLDQRIETVPHLETLMILWESGSAWDAGNMAVRIYLDPSTAGAILRDLRHAGLAITTDEILFSYDGTWDHTRLMMARVAHTYRQNVARVAMHIHGRGSSSVRKFARAFDMKKER